ncbi:hypothetical protein [uncultured Jatrophihabitans sp.]|uniref:hypothetical protein n=1 Tax=uncultured Jatrophihabitans sp. TaxID=1610747 RepID=UPI0035CA32EA
MPTAAAARSVDSWSAYDDAVSSLPELIMCGRSASEVRANLDAHRWQRVGRSIVRHNGRLSDAELRSAALINLGPRALLTSFTGLHEAGLQGWEREPVHVLVPRGARVRRPAGIPLRVHYTDQWPEWSDGARRDRVGHAAVLAASSFTATRPACGLLAANVQQRLIRPHELVRAVESASRTRHRHALLAAAHDITQGAQALSEIDLARLCRRYGLPEPRRQAVRREPSGRRRYLDAEWRSSSGKRIVAEIDGALHLIVGRWWEDQLRQNELAISGDVVLRFPTAVVRGEENLVVDQLGRALAT